MANETLGASFSIDITELKAGIAQANRLIRESESEFREAAAGMDDWTESQEGLEKRQKALNTQIDLQKSKIENLKEQRKLTIEQMEKEGKSAEEIAKATDNVNQAITRESKQLDKLRGELKKTEKAMDKLSGETEDAEKSVEDLGDAADDSGGKLGGLKGAAGVAVGAVAAVGAACVAAVGAFLGLAESTRESRTEMGKLETSFQTAGLSAENAEQTFTDLYGILGDEGAAVEAAQQLAKISKDEEDLAANTRILTGVMAEYGNSIPLEGLAEGIAASSKMSSVQGVLADALEWQGVNLDDYNEKLGKLKTEEERAAFIQQTLTDLYGESADAYRENNAAIIEAQEAQANMNNALNELGAIAEPIMTTLKNLAADLLTTITPFVSLIGEGLSRALNGTAGAAHSMAAGLSGILDTALSMIADALPFVLDTVISIVPKLLESLNTQAPVILGTLLGMVEKIVSELLPVLLGQLPSILTTLSQMVIMASNSVSTMIPTIVQSVMDVLPLLINSLLSAIPQLLQAAVTLLMALVRAVPVIIQSLTAALPSVIKTLISALVSSIPILLEASIQLLMALVDAIPTIIDALIENLPLIIDCLISGLLDALPQLLDAAVTLLFAIIEAIPVITEQLFSKMPQIIGAILSSLSNAVPKLFSTAKQLLSKIGDAIGDLVKQLPAKMKQVITSIVTGLKEGLSKIKTVGSDLVKGLWNGIKDMTSWIIDKVKGFGENILSGLKSFFKIKSPSRVMADVVGKNLALGIGKGFTDNIGEVNKEIQGSFNLKPVPVQFAANGGAGGLASGSAGGVVVNQYNTYSQAHSRYEIWQSQQNTAAAVKLAMMGG